MRISGGLHIPCSRPARLAIPKATTKLSSCLMGPKTSIRMRVPFNFLSRAIATTTTLLRLPHAIKRRYRAQRRVCPFQAISHTRSGRSLCRGCCCTPRSAEWRYRAKKRSCPLQANPLANEVLLGKGTTDHLRVRDQLRLPDDLAVTVDDAESRLLQRPRYAKPGYPISSTRQDPVIGRR